MRNLIEMGHEKIENALISAKLKVSRAVDKFLNNEDGDIIQTVIIIAILATLTIVVVVLIGNATKSRAQDAADAITDFKTYK